ncbi:MAG: branched-chain amino acid ABC transporter permease [Proteobacteria bacterium]|nr:branched-chain amino acid ABC transporter permease [Pseudomonadota bacterium]
MKRLPSGVYNETYAQDMAVIRTKAHWVLTVLALLLAFSVPWLVSPTALQLFIKIAIYVLAAIGLNILVGYAGQISMAHAAFMAVGAYTSAILNLHGVPFFLGILIGGLLAGIVGIIVGFPSLRIKGFYLILATMAAQFILIYVIEHWTDLTGGMFGIEAGSPVVFGYDFGNDRDMYLVVLVFLLAGTFFAQNLSRTRTGRAFVAIRDSDLAAEVMGIHIARYKLIAFFIGCFYAGVAGALMAHWLGAITTHLFGMNLSVWLLAYCLIGGMGHNVGPFFGVPILILLSEALTAMTTSLSLSYPWLLTAIIPLHDLIYGLAIVLFLIFEPRGLGHRWNIFKTSYRLWPFSY